MRSAVGIPRLQAEEDVNCQKNVANGRVTSKSIRSSDLTAKSAAGDGKPAGRRPSTNGNSLGGT